MKKVKFVSMDPSLRNTAIVWGTIEEVEIEEGVYEIYVIPEGYELSQTKPRPKKEKVAVATATVEDCEKTLSNIGRIINREQPNVCFAEVPSGSKSSAAMKSYGVSCAFIGHMKQHESKLITVTPRELKMGTVGNPKATKTDMIDWAEKKFPYFPFERHKSGEIMVGRMEHVADAIAAAVSGLKKYLG